MPIPKSLPSLPTSKTWGTYFPRKSLWKHQPGDRPYKGRVLLTNRKLLDDFVKALGIRKGELVIDAFAGNGNLTRSLLSGGRTKHEININDEKEGTKWPAWKSSEVDSDVEESGGETESPALVVSCDPSLEMLEAGLDFDGEQEPPYPDIADFTRISVQPSKHHPDLLLSHSSPYRWPTLPGLIDHPVVKEKLEAQKQANWEELPNITVTCQVPDSEVGEQMISQWIGSISGDENKRYWLWQYGRVRLALLVSQGVYDRMMASPRESINCRLSILTSALFHRRPLPPYHHVPNIDKTGRRTEPYPIGTVGYVKKGPKPPKPPKPPKVSKRGRKAKVLAVQQVEEEPETESDPEAEEDPDPEAEMQSEAEVETGVEMETKAEPETPPGYLDPSSPAPTEDVATWMNKRTTSYPSDYYPARPAGPGQGGALVRPALFGIELIPRTNTVVLPDQKDTWDFILRSCFTRESQSLKTVLPNLGFGTENLVPRIEDKETDKFRGPAFSADKKVRDITVEEWARVVDVFYKWPFKPTSLLLDVGSGAELSSHTRDIGHIF